MKETAVFLFPSALLCVHLSVWCDYMINLGRCFSSTVYLFPLSPLKQGLSLIQKWPIGLFLTGQWTLRSPWLPTLQHVIPDLMWGVGIELRSAHLLGEHFTVWAVSLPCFFFFLFLFYLFVLVFSFIFSPGSFIEFGKVWGNKCVLLVSKTLFFKGRNENESNCFHIRLSLSLRCGS